MNEEKYKIEIKKALNEEPPYDNGGFIHSGIILYIQKNLKSFGNKHGIYQILNTYLKNKKTKVYKQQCLFPCDVKEVIFLAKKYIRDVKRKGD
jgi:hypothetical protein